MMSQGPEQQFSKSNTVTMLQVISLDVEMPCCEGEFLAV